MFLVLQNIRPLNLSFDFLLAIVISQIPCPSDFFELWMQRAHQTASFFLFARHFTVNVSRPWRRINLQQIWSLFVIRNALGGLSLTRGRNPCYRVQYNVKAVNSWNSTVNSALSALYLCSNRRITGRSVFYDAKYDIVKYSYMRENSLRICVQIFRDTFLS